MINADAMLSSHTAGMINLEMFMVAGEMLGVNERWERGLDYLIRELRVGLSYSTAGTSGIGGTDLCVIF